MTEQTQVSLGGPGRPGHPGLEELAALAEQVAALPGVIGENLMLSDVGVRHILLVDADDRCRSADAARVRAHLASCEECYEVFLETVQLLEELEEVKGQVAARPAPGSGKPSGEMGGGDVPRVEQELPEKKGEPGRVLPFPFNEYMKPHYQWAAAALVVAALGAGLYQSGLIPGFSRSRSATPSVAGLAASAGAVPRVGDLAWGERVRGVGSHEGDPSFRLGVELLNLQVALKSKDPSSADAAAAATNGLLDSIAFLDPKSKDFYVQLRTRLPKQPPERLGDETAKEANVLYKSESIDKLYFELGSWAEAGRFAAYSKNPAYFAETDSGDFLSRLRKDGEVAAEVKTALETIDAKLAAPGTKDYPALARAFDQILKAYYAEGERGGL
ncbi:MAG TPA: zf-HC2 domain-containing protein [Thermoanaerobaculia bacterium]|nr:zf-HC2 domain-containing protein [Thermoanaerobaculia bacterium]